MQTITPKTNMPAKVTGQGEVGPHKGEIIATFSFTINFNDDSVEQTDALVYKDFNTNIHLKATTFDGLVIEGKHAWFSGIGVMEDKQAVRFTVEVYKEPDRFFISIPVLSGYEAGGELAGGDLRIL